MGEDWDCAIARQLVELHGGTLQAQSQGVGQGATFTLQLPLISPLVDSTKKQTNRAIQAIDSNYLPVDNLPQLEGLRVLAIDDDEDNREFIQVALQEYNIKVLTADSAGAAMEVVAQNNLDAIVSDIGMPDENGYELIKRIRAWERDRGLSSIPAIALHRLRLR